MLALLIAVFLTFILPDQMVTVYPTPIENTPKSVDLYYEDVTFPASDGSVNISAWWIPADNANKVLIFVHGAGGNKEVDYFGGLEFFKAMNEHSVSVLSVDLRNHGASDQTEDHRMNGGATEKYDVIGALNFLDQRGNSLPVFALGNSMGGGTVIRAAAAPEEKDRIRGLVLFDSLLDLKSATTNFVRANTGLPDLLIHYAFWSAKLRYDLPPEEPLTVAKKLNMPILVIHDERDPISLLPFARELASANENANLFIVKHPTDKEEFLDQFGPWYSHSRGFLLSPETVVHQIVSFLNDH